MDPRRLREATREEHEATESLMPLTAPELTRELYVRVLQVLEPLVRSWEQWAEAVAPPSLRLSLAQRKRSHWLVEDLRVLGGAPGGTGAMTDWSTVVATDGEDARQHPDDFAARFLGAMYVMEGSTLGGRFIAKHVEGALGLEAGQGDAYFQGHGQATGAMWREVTARIAEVPESRSAMVIEGARRAFGVFGDALRAGKVASPSGRP